MKGCGHEFPIQGKITKLGNDGYYGYINYDDRDVPFNGYEIISEGWVSFVVVMVTVNVNYVRHQLLERKYCLV